MSLRDPETLDRARTLVLDVTYQPSLVVGWEKAMTALCKGAATLVVAYEHLLVRSVRETWRCPAVISSRGRAKNSRRGSGFTRLAVYRRDGYRCQYCGEGFAPDELTLDHVLPKSRGGKLTWDNTVTACRECNQRKKDRTPKEAGMSVLNVPCAPGYASFAELHDLSKLPSAWAPFLERSRDTR